ncbi:MAG: hypothetical protein M1832_002798 [Thelocarpon impressellum]|nr:MAG: hypothetical protein M1832_002798 [Thelocarpon impressellum]
MADAPEDRDGLISQFCALTGATPHEAEQYLATNRWDLSGAAAEYYMSKEEAEEPEGTIPSSSEDEGVPHDQGGGRTLGGGPAPPSAIPTVASSRTASSAKANKPSTNKKFATLKDLGQESGHSHGGGRDDDDGDDDDDYDDDEKHDLFAGGEKSALAVQNPGDPRNQVRDILNKAKKNMPRPGGDDQTPTTSRFRGSGMTLGGEDRPSELVPDPSATVSRPRAPVTRTLHFWRDGFSVEDGSLYRFDDPANGPILSLIRSGRAPLDIMGVEPDQPVDVTVHQHEHDFVQPKKKYKPFAGGGQRLGSPTPGGGTSSGGSSAQTAAAVPAATPSSGSAATSPVVTDQSQPTVMLQIRLGDGSRTGFRFNTTHTIGDVYRHVDSTSGQSESRPWVLMTTFPSKELTDKDAVLGDMAEFKRGGVVVQKWT